MTDLHPHAQPSPPSPGSHTYSLHQRAKAVFLQVFDLSVDARPAAIDTLCGTDLTLRAEVLSLLYAAGDEAAPLLDDSDSALQAARRLNALLPDSHAGFAPGTTLGKYTIQNLIGEGGMGMVYAATQESPQRSVALKVIRPAMLTEGAARRFRHEASLLARLQHPGIAAIYDAGREPPGPGGTPFLAMELIHGAPLHEHVRSTSPSRADRLTLFLSICDAVAHAHQRGIIHQDLKPANILVEPSGRVRVMDFGIARLIAHDPLSTLHATDASSIAGTLAYMSPEQAAGDTAQIDTRTDVYALGVILYELLSGQRPIILDRLSLAQSLDHIRTAEPAQLASHDRSLVGDLDVICHRALSKDPARRYPSVEALAADIRRHLEDLPILARADSWGYVASRFLRRHRFAAAVAISGLLGIIAFAGYAKVQERRQTLATARAEAATLKATQEEARAELSATQLASELRRSRIERARLLAQNGNLTAAEELLWRYHLESPQARDTQWALRELYTRFRSLRAYGGHDVVMSAIALHPDGTTIAAPGNANSILLTDGLSGSTRQVLPFEARRAIELEFFNSGQSLLAILSDGTLIRWDANTSGQFNQVWLVKPLNLGADLCILPERNLVFAAGGVGPILALDLSSGTTSTTIPLSSSRARCHTLAVNGSRDLLAVGCDGSSSFLAPLTPLLSADPNVRKPIGNSRASLMSVAFTPDDSQLWSGDNDGTIRRWNPSTGALLGEISLKAGPVRHIEFSSTQALITSAWRSDLFDIETLQPVPTFDGSFTRGFDALFAPALRGYLAAAADGAVRLWSLPESAPAIAHPVASLDDLETTLQSPHLATGGNGLMARALPDGSASVEYQSKLWLTIPREKAQFVSLSTDGTTAAFIDKELTVAIYRYPDTTPFRSVKLSANPDTIAVSPHTLIAAGPRGSYSFHDLSAPDNTPPVVNTNLPTQCLDVTISRDGRWAISTQRQFRVSLWNARTGQRLLDLRPDNIIWHVAFSPDGSRIAAGTFSGDVEIYDTPTLTRIWSAQAHSRMVSSIAFSSDGRDLISTSIDGAVKIWNANDGQPLATLRDPTDAPGMAIRSAAYSESDATLHLIMNSLDVITLPLHAADDTILAHRAHMTARIAALDARPLSPPTAQPTSPLTPQSAPSALPASESRAAPRQSDGTSARSLRSTVPPVLR